MSEGFSPVIGRAYDPLLHCSDAAVFMNGYLNQLRLMIADYCATDKNTAAENSLAKSVQELLNVFERKGQLLSPSERLTLLENQLQLLHVGYFSNRPQRRFSALPNLQCLDLIARYRGLLNQVLLGQAWSPVYLAEQLVSRVISCERDFYPSIPEAFRHILGDQGIDAFYQALKSRWDQLPPLQKNVGFEEELPYFHIQRLLVERARAQNNTSALVDIYFKTATNGQDYLRLFHLCSELALFDQAEFWLHKLQHLGRASMDVLHAEVTLYSYQCDWPRANTSQWHIYCQDLGQESLQKLLDIAEKRDQLDACKQQVELYLLSHLHSRANRVVGSSIGPVSDALFEFYCAENDWQKALDIAAQQAVSADLLLILARQLHQRPIAVLPLYFKVASVELAASGRQAYGRVVALLEEVKSILCIPAHHLAFNDALVSLTQGLTDLGLRQQLMDAFNSGVQS